MKEKPFEGQKSKVDQFERIEGIECPEDKENFEGQKILVIGGPDGHGISMAVSSAKYLERRGAQVDIYVGSPVIRGGKGATHPGAFYKKTIPELNVENYDRVVIVDIPLDFRDLLNSEKALVQLDEKVREGRQKRNLPPIEHTTFYIDHHSTTKFSLLPESVVVKIVPMAEACKLGGERTKIAWIGAICDRDKFALESATEEEKELAKGLDIAVRPIRERPELIEFLNPDSYRRYINDLTEWMKRFEERVSKYEQALFIRGNRYEKFYNLYIQKYPPPVPANYAEAKEVENYKKAIEEWEEEAQKRLEEAVIRLKNEDWDYFINEARAIERQLNKLDIPIASGFGRIILVDTQDLTRSFSVFKLMEQAIKNMGPDKFPYAIAILRSAEDLKMGRPPADLISIIRFAEREDLPSVKEVITTHFGEDFFEKYKMYGAENAQTVRLPLNNRETAKIAAELIRIFAGKEIPDFSQVRSVIICGDPNSGKSVYSTILREALKTLGVKVAHLDLDKAAPTPQWYLEAEIKYKETEFLFSQGKATQEQLEEARKQLEEATERRRAMKKPWSMELAEEAKQELLKTVEDEEIDLVIADIGGGKIKRDEKGNIIKITRLTAENAKILEGTDAVIIVSNNPQGAAEWRKLIEAGVDPETGVRINREKPIQILGVYQSILEGNVQEIATGEKTGIITNLDRSKAEKKYNPAIFTTAIFFSEAVKKRKKI